MDDLVPFIPLKITFHLDGTGLHYNPWEPIHLDALLSWVYSPYYGDKRNIQRTDIPKFIPLPLRMWEINECRGFYASALFPEGKTCETYLMLRKRFSIGKEESIVSGSPNLQNGPYRDYNTTLPLLLCHSLVAWAVGNQAKVRTALRKIKFLGKKRNIGIGRIIDLSVDEVESDFSLVKDGQAMRWLPLQGGTRLVRVTPPYWNITERVECCEVLQPYSLPIPKEF